MIMLTSHGQRGDAQRFRDAGFSGYLVKPLRASLLIGVVRAAWAAHLQGDRSMFITRHSLAEAHTPELDPPPRDASQAAITLRVLLAEDNLVNQKIATAMLEKMGCRVDLAANGQEVVDMMALMPYDVVFMDCQMPVMDGFEATVAIRQQEEVTNGHVTIVAMTANVMEGDRERCLAAGMDDYLSKPIERSELQRVIRDQQVAAPRPSGAGEA